MVGVIRGWIRISENGKIALVVEAQRLPDGEELPLEESGDRGSRVQHLPLRDLHERCRVPEREEEARVDDAHQLVTTLRSHAIPHASIGRIEAAA